MAVLRGSVLCTVLRHTASPAKSSFDCARLFFRRGFGSKLFVKGISFSTTEQSLAESFSQFGQVLEARVIMDEKRNRPKGYAYVTFSTAEEAEKAVTAMNGEILDGRVIFVDKEPSNRSKSGKRGARELPPQPRPD